MVRPAGSGHWLLPSVWHGYPRGDELVVPLLTQHLDTGPLGLLWSDDLGTHDPIQDVGVPSVVAKLDMIGAPVPVWPRF